MWSLALQMKQLSPGFMPGTLRGCLFLEPGFDSALRLNALLFFFFFFLLGSLGGVGSAFGNSSGFSDLNRFRASRCLWLTISNLSPLPLPQCYHSSTICSREGFLFFPFYLFIYLLRFYILVLVFPCQIINVNTLSNILSQYTVK